MRRVQIPVVILAVAVAASLYGWTVVVTTSFHPGRIGLNLNALGTDWMVFYGGARQFFAGHLTGLYDGDAFTAYLNGMVPGWLSAPLPYRPFIYPPSYLALLLPFAVLPFLASYIVFQVSSAALLGAALWFGADRPRARGVVLAAALLGPAAAMNVAQGQNGFLTAALLVAGLRLTPVRPVLAGILLGVLTIKPQFWLLVPVALVAWRQWRALAWSIVAAGALVAGSALIFGVAPWHTWLDLSASLTAPDAKWVEYGRRWGVGVFACLYASGFSGTVANAVQTGVTLGAIGLTYALFRRDDATDRKIAALLAMTVLAAPHVSPHDLVLLAVAAGLWIAAPAERPRSLAEWTLALTLVIAAVFNPPLVSPIARLLPLVILGFVGLVMTQERGSPGLAILDLPRMRRGAPPHGL